MEGDLAPLPELVEIAGANDAVLIVDDSHGIGVLGETGAGAAEHFGLHGEVDVITGTIGKALGGAAGGFVAGSRGALRGARAALAPAALLQRAAADRGGQRRRARCGACARAPSWSRACTPRRRAFASACWRRGSSRSRARARSSRSSWARPRPRSGSPSGFSGEGVFVTGFGYPVVPEGTARIRAQISAALTDEQLERAVAAIAAAAKAEGLL